MRGMIYGSKVDLLKSDKVCFKSDLEIIKNNLKIGETYKFVTYRTKSEEGKEGRRKVRVEKKMKLVAKYPFIALFLDKNGHHTSFGYWEISKMIKGEEYE